MTLERTDANEVAATNTRGYLKRQPVAIRMTAIKVQNCSLLVEACRISERLLFPTAVSVVVRFRMDVRVNLQLLTTYVSQRLSQSPNRLKEHTSVSDSLPSVEVSR